MIDWTIRRSQANPNGCAALNGRRRHDAADWPGGNVSGLSLVAADYSEKWLELLREALPKLHGVAVLWNPDNPSIALEMERLQVAARALGLNLTAFSGKPNDIEV